MSIELSQIRGAFDDYLTERLDRESTQALIADWMLSPVPNEVQDVPQRADRTLAFNLAEVFCGLDGPEADTKDYVSRVVACLDQVSDPDDVFDLIPLILHHDEFAILVSKHQRGLISSAGLQSIIAKRFRFTVHREWLGSASIGQLNALSQRIEGDDYRGAASVLATPPSK